MRRLMLLLNLVILLLLVFVGRQVVGDWREFEDRNDLLQMAKRAVGPGVEVEVPAIEVRPEAPFLPFPDFLVVADRNLFSPERRPAVEEAEVAAITAVEVPQPPPLPVKPALNGVLSLRGEKQAFLTVFAGNNAQGQPRTVRVGDVVEGYQITEITETMVRLSWNDHHVLLDRDSAPRPQRERAARAAPAVNIIKVGSAVAFVETTTPDGAGAEERRGVEVGVVGSQGAAQPGRTPQRGGAATPGALGGGRGRTGAPGANLNEGGPGSGLLGSGPNRLPNNR